MKKQIKKQILEFLHFWPMTIVVPILLLLILFPGIANAKVKAKDIEFPAGVYTDEIKFCSAIGYASLDQNFDVWVKKVKSRHSMQDFPGFDWSTYHTEYGDSRDSAHDIITYPAKTFAAVAHNAIGSGNQDKIDRAIQYLIKVAENKTLLNTITPKQLQSKPACWKNGDPTSPCWYHQYEVAYQTWTVIMIGATQLKPYMTEKEIKIVNKWAKKFWGKYYRPRPKGTEGFYAHANGGLGILIYAHWSDNKKLAAKEINHRLKRIDHYFMEDGYIKGNSFRGHRAQWYHTYGVNAALGYIWIAKQFGAVIPEKIENKIINSLHVSNLAIEDREKFLSREWNKKRKTNFTIEAGMLDKITHTEALGLDTLMLEMYGIELANDPVYLNIRVKSGIDNNIGFNPNCIN